MNTHRARVYGAALGVTILLWVIAVYWAEAKAPSSTPGSLHPSQEPVRSSLPSVGVLAPADTAHNESVPEEPPQQKQITPANTSPKEEKASSGVNITGSVQGPVVISQNQKGGQTAHTINNFGPPARQVPADAKTRMVETLTPHAGSCIAFASTQGDPEAADFKRQLISIFKEAGWDARDAETFMFFGSRRGLVITLPFGAGENGLPQVVAQALRETGQPVTGNRGDMANECGFYIQVWHAPAATN